MSPELLGDAFASMLVSDRFSAYNDLTTRQRQLCRAPLIGDLTAIAERSGLSAGHKAQRLKLQ